MALVGKPLVTYNSDGKAVKFQMLERRLDHPTDKYITSDMFHFVNPESLSADDLPAGLYITLEFEDAKKIVSDGKRQVIVFMESYAKVRTSYWISLKGNEPIRSLTKDITTEVIQSKYGEHITIEQLEKLNELTDFMCYIFVLSN